MTYCYSLNDVLSQGDILRGVKIMTNVKDSESDNPQYGNSHVIVVSRNCEIDKPFNDRHPSSANSLLVASITRLLLAPANLQGYIKEQRVLNAFFLPQSNYIDDCYIDWRTLQPIYKGNLLSLRTDPMYYQCSIQQEVIKECLASLILFLTKLEK